MQTVNTEEIMKQIRTEIKEKGLDSSVLSFEEIPFTPEISRADSNFQPASLQQSAEYLNIRNQIEAYKPLEGNFLIVFIKKILRKLIKFYIMPIMTEQNALNLHTANAVQQVNNYIQGRAEADKIDVASLVSRIDALEAKQAANRQELSALRSQIKALQAENQELKGLKL